MKDKFVFNRVLGLKFLYDNFNYYFNDERIKLFFANSKQELFNLEIPENYFDTFVLKRCGDINKIFISDLKCKDNRFFNNFNELKNGANEFNDNFIFCVECHKFKKGENYYSDRLAIAQFSTKKIFDGCDLVSFIPARVPGVSTRDNLPYLVLEYPYNFSNTFHVNYSDFDKIKNYNFSYYDISYLAIKIHNMIENIREYLIELKIYDTFQLIIRIDSYLNLLPIDFRTTGAWKNLR